MTALTCHEVLAFLSDYLDGNLPSETAHAFVEHLALCPPCVNYLESFQTTIRAARSACCCESAPPIPEELVQAILTSRKQT